MASYPTLPLPAVSKIQILTDRKSINDTMKPILNKLDSLPDGKQIICGLDCEWVSNPTRQKIALFNSTGIYCVPQ